MISTLSSLTFHRNIDGIKERWKQNKKGASILSCIIHCNILYRQFKQPFSFFRLIFKNGDIDTWIT